MLIVIPFVLFVEMLLLCHSESCLCFCGHAGLAYALSRTEDVELEFSAALEVDDDFSSQMNDSLGIRDVIPGERATSSMHDVTPEAVADLHNMGAKRAKGAKPKPASKSQEPMEAMMT
jgi:hypothetical protein